MPLPDPGQTADFIQTVGFPAAVAIAAIAIGAVALWFQHKDHKAEIARLIESQASDLAYIEARRMEERDGRIAAERRVSELTERWDRALQIMANVEREMIRAVARGDK